MLDVFRLHLRLVATGRPVPAVSRQRAGGPPPPLGGLSAARGVGPKAPEAPAQRGGAVWPAGGGVLPGLRAALAARRQRQLLLVLLAVLREEGRSQDTLLLLHSARKK